MSKHMKSATANNLTYAGIVTLSQHIRGKTFTIAQVHNAGGMPLFNFLVNCLVGDGDLAKLDPPNKIMLLNIDDTGNISKASNDTDFIFRIGTPEKVYSSNEGIVRYSFIVPQEYFAGTAFNAIGLYTKSTPVEEVSDFAALCAVDTEILNNLSMSSVLVLDWELHIANKSSNA